MSYQRHILFEVYNKVLYNTLYMHIVRIFLDRQAFKQTEHTWSRRWGFFFPQTSFDKVLSICRYVR